MPPPFDPAACRRALADDLFGGPLITNHWRGEWAERLVLAGLGPGWRQVGGGWASYDLEGPDGQAVEVKQAAARQSWHAVGDPPSRPAFDIAARTGRWEGTAWRDAPGRAASAYVFAWHPVADETADHTDASQWRFSVVRADALPDQKTMGLRALARLAAPVAWDALGAALHRVR